MCAAGDGDEAERNTTLLVLSHEQTRVLTIGGDEFGMVSLPGLEEAARTLAIDLVSGTWTVQVTPEHVHVLGPAGRVGSWTAPSPIEVASLGAPSGVSDVQPSGQVLLACQRTLVLLHVDPASGTISETASRPWPQQISALHLGAVGTLGDVVAVVAEWVTNKVHVLSCPDFTPLATVACDSLPRSLCTVTYAKKDDGVQWGSPQRPFVVAGLASGTVLVAPVALGGGAAQAPPAARSFAVGTSAVELLPVARQRLVYCKSSTGAVLRRGWDGWPTMARVANAFGFKSVCAVHTPVLPNSFACVSQADELLFGAVSEHGQLHVTDAAPHAAATAPPPASTVTPQLLFSLYHAPTDQMVLVESSESVGGGTRIRTLHPVANDRMMLDGKDVTGPHVTGEHTVDNAVPVGATIAPLLLGDKLVHVLVLVVDVQSTSSFLDDRQTTGRILVFRLEREMDNSRRRKEENRRKHDPKAASAPKRGFRKKNIVAQQK